MASNNLRERMEQILRMRNYSDRTIETYVSAMTRYANYWWQRPDRLGAEQVRSYQIWLRDDKHVSSSYFNQAAAALRFFYTYVASGNACRARLSRRARDPQSRASRGLPR